MKPDELGNNLGKYLVENAGIFSAYRVVSGFLNLTVTDAYWSKFLTGNFNNPSFASSGRDKKVMVEEQKVMVAQ